MCSNQLSYVALPTCSVASGAYYANLLAIRQPFFSKKLYFFSVCLNRVQIVLELCDFDGVIYIISGKKQKRTIALK
jgi:hypothetical protein